MKLNLEFTLFFTKQPVNRVKWHFVCLSCSITISFTLAKQIISTPDDQFLHYPKGHFFFFGVFHVEPSLPTDSMGFFLKHYRHYLQVCLTGYVEPGRKRKSFSPKKRLFNIFIDPVILIYRGLDLNIFLCFSFPTLG